MYFKSNQATKTFRSYIFFCVQMLREPYYSLVDDLQVNVHKALKIIFTTFIHGISLLITILFAMFLPVEQY